MQKKLANIHIEAEHEGVFIVINANMEVISTTIQDDAWERGKKHVETAYVEAFKKGMKKAQEVAAENMQEILGSMGLPSGLEGMA